jgi:hypothetical protein
MELLWLSRLADSDFREAIRSMIKFAEYMECSEELCEATGDKTWGIGMEKDPEDEFVYQTIMRHIEGQFKENPQLASANLTWPGKNNIDKTYRKVKEFITREDGSLLEDDKILEKVKTLPPFFQVVDEGLVSAKREAEAVPEGSSSSKEAKIMEAPAQSVEAPRPPPPRPAPSSWDKFDW